MGIDELGLDSTDKNVVLSMIDKFGGRPVGLDTIAASTGEDATTIEDVYEPYLLQIGFLAVGSFYPRHTSTITEKSILI